MISKSPPVRLVSFCYLGLGSFLMDVCCCWPDAPTHNFVSRAQWNGRRPLAKSSPSSSSYTKSHIRRALFSLSFSLNSFRLFLFLFLRQFKERKNQTKKSSTSTEAWLATKQQQHYYSKATSRRELITRWETMEKVVKLTARHTRMTRLVTKEKDSRSMMTSHNDEINPRGSLILKHTHHYSSSNNRVGEKTG